ncbi:hypothetical protein [Propioniciclava soli]|uniref:Integral membrane protein n=1 Tax=Propioniciclava soli TaxID=2775081 RepID=A0ABZ3C7S6_9ACTN|nr:hypothetical protein [Propioniciclava soli]
MDEAREVERWFRRRGFTALLDGTAMHRSPATLARVLTVLLAVTLLVLMPLEAPHPWIALGVGVALLLGAWVGLNLARRRRPLAPPRVVGVPERVVFVLLPALAYALTPRGGDADAGIPLSAAWLVTLLASAQVVVQLVVLAVAPLIVRSGILAVFPWLGRQVALAFLSAGVALGRTLPLLLGVVGLFYFTGEIWQSVGRLASWAYLGVLLLFGVLSWMFIHSRQHLDLTALATFDDADEIDRLLAATPLAPRAGEIVAPVRTPLGDRHEHDLRLVVTSSRVTVVTVISAAVFAFFMLLGWLAINAETVRAWIGADPAVLFSFETSRHRYDLTWEHLRVAGFLGVFAGFYYAVVSRTDAALRDSMVDTAEDTVREACAARLVALTRYPRVPDAHADPAA